MPDAVIETRDLWKSYQLGEEEIAVLKGIHFAVPQGSYTAIMGHSGAGKSTLLNILGCLDIPSRGEYLFNGRSVGRLSASRLADIRNREIGFVFQNFNLLPKLTIEANVELPLIYGNIPARERRRRTETALRRFGLWERRGHKPNEISGGQKQRVAIARALVKSPSVILADEPTGNLDSATTAEIMHVFDELHQEGNTILVITHENDVAKRAQEIIRLVDGQIIHEKQSSAEMQ
jgi:putative ABC transport system ATP-binding protein